MQFDEEIIQRSPTATNSSQRGLCHSRKSEPESLIEQPIAATESSQCGLCHNKESEPESFVEKPGVEQEINHQIAPANDYLQIRQMPTTINPVDFHMQPP